MILFKLIRKVLLSIYYAFQTAQTYLLFYMNNVKFKTFKTFGKPWILVARKGEMSIGANFMMNNNTNANPIGCFQKCSFFVDRNAKLTIGNNVGLSQTAIICHKSITIGDNVMIGGGTYIYDTDFHSLDFKIRNTDADKINRVDKPIKINNNVFIGAHCIILKGVEIGENSIIGAGSIVTKTIPSNEIWAGNPAKFIRKL